MIKGIFVILCSAVLCCSSGCLFSRKSKGPKESQAIAADVEESFRQRWVTRRAAELAAEGTAADAARNRAENEFRERFDFTRPAQK